MQAPSLAAAGQFWLWCTAVPWCPLVCLPGAPPIVLPGVPPAPLEPWGPTTTLTPPRTSAGPGEGTGKAAVCGPCACVSVWGDPGTLTCAVVCGAM